MGIQERRLREKEETREKIMDGARALFAEEGYEAVTMRRIAEKIEYSPTAIYFHFTDKADLFRAICAEDFLSLAKRFQTIAKIGDPIERLDAIGRAYADFAFRHPNHYRLMFMTPYPAQAALPEGPTAEECGSKGNPEEDAYAFLLASVTTAIEAGRLRADLTDPHLVSQILWSAIHGIVSLRITKFADPWVEWRGEKRLVETMIDALMHGIERPRKKGSRLAR